MQHLPVILATFFGSFNKSPIVLANFFSNALKDKSKKIDNENSKQSTQRFTWKILYD